MGNVLSDVLPGKGGQVVSVGRKGAAMLPFGEGVLLLSGGGGIFKDRKRLPTSLDEGKRGLFWEGTARVLQSKWRGAMIGRDFWGEREFKGAGQQLSTKKKRPRQRLQENQHKCLQEGNTIRQGRRPAGSKAYHTMQKGKYINSLRELGKGCRYVHGWGRLQPHGGGGAKEVGASKYEALWGEYECQ